MPLFMLTLFAVTGVVIIIIIISLKVILGEIYERDMDEYFGGWLAVVVVRWLHLLYLLLAMSTGCFTVLNIFKGVVFLKKKLLPYLESREGCIFVP